MVMNVGEIDWCHVASEGILNSHMIIVLTREGSNQNLDCYIVKVWSTRSTGSTHNLRNLKLGKEVFLRDETRLTSYCQFCVS